MSELTLEFLRKALGTSVTGFEATVIKKGFVTSTVSRVRLESTDTSAPRTVILKSATPPWQDDPFGPEREIHVYDELLAHIPVPQARRYFSELGGTERDTQIVMQDLNDAYIFYPETHLWSWTQAQAMLRVLARVHNTAQTLDIASRPYLMSRLCTRWTPQRVREMFTDLANTSWLHERVSPALGHLETILSELPALERIAAHEPLTLIHYDVYPPNVAFSRDATEPAAVLIDWATAAADMAEVDLAFLFQQPYDSDRLLDWRTALRFYWDERACLTGEAYDWDERCAVFRYGRVQAIFTILLAVHRGWQKNMREGTRMTADSPDPFMRYYDAALTRIIKTMQALTEDPLRHD